MILNCLSEHAAVVLAQAQPEGMLAAGWVWILTDGVTATVSTAATAAGVAPSCEEGVTIRGQHRALPQRVLNPVVVCGRAFVHAQGKIRVNSTGSGLEHQEIAGKRHACRCFVNNTRLFCEKMYPENGTKAVAFVPFSSSLPHFYITCDLKQSTHVLKQEPLSFYEKPQNLCLDSTLLLSRP